MVSPAACKVWHKLLVEVVSFKQTHFQRCSVCHHKYEYIGFVPVDIYIYIQYQFHNAYEVVPIMQVDCDWLCKKEIKYGKE
jgi:hypothetical protein